MVETYRYQPLPDPNRQVRLAVWSGHNISGRQQWRLRVHELDQAPLYWTISYVWGDPNDTAIVDVDGYALSIPRSLERGLNQSVLLPALQCYSQTRLLLFWADALCINQADDEEKSAQVQRMFDIYERALASIGWLGECSSDCSDALKSVRWVDLPTWELMHNPSDGTTKCLFPYPRRTESLFLSPFWTRVWIIQETLAPSRLFFLMGDTTIPSIALRAFAIYTFKHYADDYHLYQDQTLRGVSAALALLDRREKRGVLLPHQTGKLCDASTIGLSLQLVSESDSQASDPRDLVYAVLSLHKASDLRPDYGVPYYTVCTTIAIHLFRNAQASTALAQLNKCRRNRELPGPNDTVWNGMPSWVPDWRCKSATSTMYIGSGELAHVRSQTLDLRFEKVGEVKEGQPTNDQPGEWIYLSTYHPICENHCDEQLWFKQHKEGLPVLLEGDIICRPTREATEQDTVPLYDFTVLRSCPGRGSYRIENAVPCSHWIQCRPLNGKQGVTPFERDDIWESDQWRVDLSSFVEDCNFPEETFNIC